MCANDLYLTSLATRKAIVDAFVSPTLMVENYLIAFGELPSRARHAILAPGPPYAKYGSDFIGRLPIEASGVLHNIFK